jgi:hypothetical protein
VLRVSLRGAAALSSQLEVVGTDAGKAVGGGRISSTSDVSLEPVGQHNRRGRKGRCFVCASRAGKVGECHQVARTPQETKPENCNERFTGWPRPIPDEASILCASAQAGPAVRLLGDDTSAHSPHLIGCSMTPKRCAAGRMKRTKRLSAWKQVRILGDHLIRTTSGPDMQLWDSSRTS